MAHHVDLHFSDISNWSSITTTGVESINATHTSHPSSSLSSSAKAGIGVSYAILALALIGAAFLFLPRKRRNKQLSEKVEGESYTDPHNELHELASSGQKVELPANEAH
jgi:hypothetical protein